MRQLLLRLAPLDETIDASWAEFAVRAVKILVTGDIAGLCRPTLHQKARENGSSDAEFCLPSQSSHQRSPLDLPGTVAFIPTMRDYPSED
jgi:hypothetical protein